MFILILLSIIPLVTSELCYSCASLSLQDNWQVTSLPKMPDGLNFTNVCNTFGDEDVPTRDCSGVCFEMLLPLNGRASFLRGCYSDFLSSPSTVTSTNGTHCEYGPVSGEEYSKNGGTTKYPAQAAVRFCTGLKCNTYLADKSDLYSDTTTYFKDCVVPSPQHQCVSCSRFNNDGQCDPTSTSTCTASYCIKYEGYLNEMELKFRGCSPINPFFADQCPWIDTTSDFALFGLTVKEPYTGTHCYCTGDRCNPSSIISSSLIFSIILPLIITQFIPFSFSSLSLFYS